MLGKETCRRFSRAAGLSCVLLWCLILVWTDEDTISSAGGEPRSEQPFSKVLGVTKGKQQLEAFNVTPFCVGPGGWTWFRNDGEAPVLISHADLRRTINPRVLNKSVTQTEIKWDTRPALYTFPETAVSFAPNFPLYHYLWPVIQTLLASNEIRGTYGDQVQVYVQHCLQGEDWSRRLFWHGEAWVTRAKRHFDHDSCVNTTSNARYQMLRRSIGGDVREAPSPSEKAPIVCHPWGVVGAAKVRRWADRYLVTRQGWYGLVRCAKHGCKYKSLGRPAWEGVTNVRANLLRACSISVTPARSSSMKLVVISRRGTRKVARPHELARQARALNWSVDVAEFEELPMCQQFDVAHSSDVVLGVHGSALAWSLVGRPGVVWAEVIPDGPGGRFRAAADPDPKVLAIDRPGMPRFLGNGKFVSKNAGLESFGVMARYSGGRHIGWLAGCSNCTRCPPMAEGTVGANEFWKLCSVLVPGAVLRNILSVAGKIVRQEAVCPGSLGCKFGLSDEDWAAAGEEAVKVSTKE
eukprot:Hpha_TRINITY_DN34616_c0_g1::TRINITY_DN34616_c0_g1_i1::g.20998::m.20998